jgi:dTDP-L-rhamnose 4-epimerase
MQRGDFSMKCPKCGLTVKELPTDEEAFTNPVSVYGITKLAQEQLVLNAAETINVPAVALRYQNVYGPGQSLKNPYTGILSIFSTRFLSNKPVFIFEDGKESRDFVFIDDVIKANILAMRNDKANGQIINVGTGKKTSVLKVAKELKKLYKSQSDIIITGEFRKGDIRHNYADTKKIRKILGFVPRTKFSDGLQLFTNWVRQQNPTDDLYEKSLSELKSKGLLK